MDNQHPFRMDGRSSLEQTMGYALLTDAWLMTYAWQGFSANAMPWMVSQMYDTNIGLLCISHAMWNMWQGPNLPKLTFCANSSGHTCQTAHLNISLFCLCLLASCSVCCQPHSSRLWSTAILLVCLLCCQVFKPKSSSTCYPSRPHG